MFTSIVIMKHVRWERSSILVMKFHKKNLRPIYKSLNKNNLIQRARKLLHFER